MTTPVPATVEWIRFDDTLGNSVQLDASEEWQPQLGIAEQEDAEIAEWDASAHRKPQRLVTVDLVLPQRETEFKAEAAIRHVQTLLADGRYFSIEAAVTLPGSPYNRVHLPRVRVTEFAVSQIVTADGTPGLRFIEAEAHEVEPGRWCKLSHTA